MAALEARLDTARADRYLGQLSSHLSHGPGGLTVLSSSAGAVVVDLGAATWTIRATEDELVLRLDAEDPAVLAQQSERIAHRVEQIARRDGLRVVWAPVD